jgi:5-keto-L-gluconate epimerase
MSDERFALGNKMFRYGIVCALEPLPDSKPAVFRGSIEEVAASAREAGYDAMELHMRNPLRHDGRFMKKVADDNGLAFCAISTGLEYLNNGLSLISDDDGIRASAILRLKEHIDLAARLDCLLVIGSMRAHIPDMARRPRYEAWLTEALLELAAYGRGQGVSLVLESIMRYMNNYLNTAPETVDYLRRLGQPNLTLHIDTHSMHVEDPDSASAIRYCGRDIGYVHFSDSNRRFPGGGNIDFKPIIKALNEVGYAGYIGMEFVPWPDARQSARLGLEYVRALETCAQVESVR